MDNEIIVLATFTAKNGKVSALRAALEDLLEPTRREEGCLSYTLNENLNNPSVFTMIERFKNQGAFESHGNEPHMLHFKENLIRELVEMESISVIPYKEIG